MINNRINNLFSVLIHSVPSLLPFGWIWAISFDPFLNFPINIYDLVWTRIRWKPTTIGPGNAIVAYGRTLVAVAAVVVRNSFGAEAVDALRERNHRVDYYYCSHENVAFLAAASPSNSCIGCYCCCYYCWSVRVAAAVVADYSLDPWHFACCYSIEWHSRLHWFHLDAKKDSKMKRKL